MKAGLTIEELATEVMRQKDAKADYIVNTSMLAMECCGTELVLRVLDDSHIDRIEPLDIADTAHRQIGTRLGIPAKYYGKMLTEHPDLLVTNVNTWFEREPTERMLRVLDGKVRAYLSNSYMRMDHYEIFASVLPVIGEIPDVQFVSCHITDSRMYIKAVDPHLTAEVAPGDTVKAGIVISNSEVGLGSVSVQPLIYRELDGNGIAVAGATTKRIHRGRVNSAEEHFMLASQEALTEADRTFLTELQETVRSATDEEQFSQIVTLMQNAKHQAMNLGTLKAEIEDELIGGILKIAKATAGGSFVEMNLNVFFAQTLDYIKSHWEENYAFLVAQPNLAYIAKWKDAIKYHFRLRFPEKDAVPNHGLIMEVIASAVIGAYTYWMEHPDEVDTQKLADISVQMLSSVEQII